MNKPKKSKNQKNTCRSVSARQTADMAVLVAKAAEETAVLAAQIAAAAHVMQVVADRISDEAQAAAKKASR